MGVLINRLHGSITAMAALTAASVWADGPDKSLIRSFLHAAGESVLLSSTYAPTAFSSFDVDVTGTITMPMEGEMRHHYGYPQVSGSAANAGPSSYRQSTPFKFYKAAPSFHHYHSQLAIRKFQSIHGYELAYRLSVGNPDVRFHHWIPSNAFSRAYSSCPEQNAFSNLLRIPTKNIVIRHMKPRSFDMLLMKQKPTVVVVLLGWLGAEQRHLKKYADWYTSRGIHAVAFVVPMKDLLTLKSGEGAERDIDALTTHLMQWIQDADQQNNEGQLIFHTFSNTGWLIYGAILERLMQSKGGHPLDRIKGCVVDSAPSARPDAHVWASGFVAALLKKGGTANQKLSFAAALPPQPSFKEAVLLSALERFFSVFLQLPYVNRKLEGVVSVLSKQQPACPQLYIYSTADTIIPASSVEDFVEGQRKMGRVVSACNFECSPHVDHYRTFPEKYSEQLSNFLALCLSGMNK